MARWHGSGRAIGPAKSVDDELSLAELLQAVHRRRWLLLGCIFLAGLAGMGAIAALTPVYDARALLVIEPDPAAGPPPPWRPRARRPTARRSTARCRSWARARWPAR